MATVRQNIHSFSGGRLQIVEKSPDVSKQLHRIHEWRIPLISFIVFASRLHSNLMACVKLIFRASRIRPAILYQWKKIVLYFNFNCSSTLSRIRFFYIRLLCHIVVNIKFISNENQWTLFTPVSDVAITHTHFPRMKIQSTIHWMLKHVKKRSKHTHNNQNVEFK